MDARPNGHADPAMNAPGVDVPIDAPVGTEAETAPIEARKVTPEEIIANYALLRRGCLEIKHVNGTGIYAVTPSGSWTPQHILAMLLSGQLEMWGAWRGRRLRGFGITQMQQDPYAGGTVNSAFVFLAWKHPEERTNAYQIVADYIAEQMKGRGCSWLEALTRREDLVHSEYLGWHPAFIVIRKDLWEDEDKQPIGPRSRSEDQQDG